MSVAEAVRERQRAQWGAAAAGWEAHYGWYERTFRPVMTWLCDAAALRPGDRVLDIGSGSGQPALLAAARVRPGGVVTATDLSAEMLASLGRRAHREGVANVEVRVVDAEDLRFPDGSFDVALAAFVIMFCPDPARAAAEMRRILRPGGRFALAVWDEAGRNPFFGAIARPLEAFLPPRPPPDPWAPGGFRLAPPGELESALRAGGLTDVRVECVPFTMECDSLDHVWEIQTAFAPPLRAAIDSLAEAERDRLREAVAGGTTPYLRDGRLRFPTAALCACGRV